MVRSFLLIVFCCSSLHSEAQYPFMKQFTSADGLPSNTINDMLQDDEGYIWLATDQGVSRFDGTRFSNFRQSDGLADDDVIRIGKDHEGRIWFLGFNGKASFFLHGIFYNESNSPVAAQTQLGSAFAKFLISKKGTVYLVSNTDGFIQVNGNTVKNYSKENLLKQKGIVFINGFKGVKMDTAGSLWIFSKDTVSILKEEYPQVIRLSTHTFPEKIFEGFFLSDGSVVIPRNGKMIRYDGAKTDSTGDLGIQASTDYVSTEEDGSGNLWVMTKRGAYLFRDKKFDKQHQVKLLEGEYCGHVFTDNEGNTWLSPLRNGVYLIPSLDVQFLNTSNGLENNNVMAIADHLQGVIAGFSNGSAQVIQLKDHAIELLPPVAIGSYIIDILHSNKDEWLFLTNSEVITCTEKLIETKRSPFIWAKSYLQLKDGSMLIGGGFVLWWLKDDYLTSLYKFRHENRIYSIATEEKGIIWLGTEEGLYSLRDSVVQFIGTEFPILKGRINDLKIDRKGRLWIASSQSGLLLLHGRELQKVLQGGEKISGRKILITPEGVVYAGTDKGIFIIKENRDLNFQIRRIRKSDGLPSEKINSILLKHGLLWIGTDEGLEIFPVDKEFSTLKSVPIRITAFTINGSIFSPDSIADLGYQQNNIHLSFAGLCFREASSVNYRYKIRRNDTLWQYTTNTSLDLPELPSGSYEITIQASTSGSNWSATPLQLSFTVHAPFWQRAWFYALAALSIGVCILLLFRYRYKVRFQKEKQKRKLVEAELAALRSQMNPHFIFNSLNAIQDFIFQHKTEEANEYLTKFARLIRAILNQSRKQFASIEEECDLLKMYLELESLRFNHAFSWELTMGDEIIASEMMIPSMLLQPVVENSIKHGFKNAKRRGMLYISFEKNSGFIRCEVTDNGCGRMAANNSDGNSLALSITKERLDMLNQSLHQPCMMEVTDIYDGNVLAGLKTVFRFPSDISR